MVRSPGFGSTRASSDAHFGLAFATPPPGLAGLDLLDRVTRRIIMQKARSHPPCGRLELLCRLTVSGSISLGFRRSFHLSLTVLVHYRVSTCIVALEGGPPRFPPGSTCPVVLGYPLHFVLRRFHLPDCHRLWSAVPDRSIIAKNKTSCLHTAPRRPRNTPTATHVGYHTIGV